MFYSVNMNDPHSDRKNLARRRMRQATGYGQYLSSRRIGRVFRRILSMATKGEVIMKVFLRVFLVLAIAALGLPSLGLAAPILYTADLTGPNESPPNASPGTGFAEVTLDRSGSQYLTGRCDLRRLARHDDGIAHSCPHGPAVHRYCRSRDPGSDIHKFPPGSDERVIRSHLRPDPSLVI